VKSIEGMSVIVTGGGSGIGAGTALYFASHGARVTVCGRRLAKLESVAAEIGSFCQAVRADVTVDADRRRLVEAALDFGGGKLDVLVSNAGSLYRGPIDELDETKLLELFHTNVVAGMMLTGLSVPHLEKTHGAIVFIGSAHTQRTFPGAAPYAATKGAVEALTRVLAGELGRKKIRVNCVRPGAVFTELHQRAGRADDPGALERLHSLAPEHALGRIGTPQEIAEAIAHLACAEWTTGSIVSVDGGLGLGVSHA
jgi:3-oxoacyl-[acyl-carrier protein] reductase